MKVLPRRILHWRFILLKYSNYYCFLSQKNSQSDATWPVVAMFRISPNERDFILKLATAFSQVRDTRVCTLLRWWFRTASFGATAEELSELPTIKRENQMSGKEKFLLLLITLMSAGASENHSLLIIVQVCITYSLKSLCETDFLADKLVCWLFLTN